MPLYPAAAITSAKCQGRDVWPAQQERYDDERFGRTWRHGQDDEDRAGNAGQDVPASGRPEDDGSDRRVRRGSREGHGHRKGELKALDIDPSIFNGDDKEVVEDLILAAIKDAQAKAQQRSEEEMQKLTSELGLPADMKMPF